MIPLLRQRGRGRSSPVELKMETDMRRLAKLMNNSKGATAIEYGLIAALIAVAAIAALKSVGTKLGTTFNNVSNQL